MRIDRGTEIAAGATALLGVPFRLHGRSAEAGLDCVGLVALSLREGDATPDVPCDYALRGDYLGRVSAALHHAGLRPVNSPMQAGDILLCRPALRQLHLAIATGDGVVHAHAGLRRVVLTPPPLPWPVVGHWRSNGD